MATILAEKITQILWIYNSIFKNIN